MGTCMREVWKMGSGREVTGDDRGGIGKEKNGLEC